MQIGEILREQRKEKNISLDEIQTETKIQKRYLVAIEQGDFHALPGKFYARAFIKEYALAIGLDPNELLQHFDESSIESEEPTTQYTRMNRTKQSKDHKGSSFWSFLPTIIVVILIIGIIFVAWTLLQQKPSSTDDPDNSQQNNNEIYRDKNNGDQDNNNVDNESNNEDNETNNEDNNAENNAKNDEEDTFDVVEEGTGGFPESELDFTYSEDDVEVKLEASGDSYTELKGENEKDYFVGTLQADDSETYDVSDEERIFIKVGNAQGVKILINDVELEYPIDTSTVTQKLWINLKKSE